MYYARGKVYACKESDWGKDSEEAIEEIDFIPEEQCPIIIEQVELDIKRHEYEKLSSQEDITFEEFAQNYSFRFVGSYNGTFVITEIKTIYRDYPTNVPPPRWVAGFVWSGAYANDLFAFRYE